MKLLFWFNRKFRWNFLLNKKALRVGLTEKQMKRAMKSSAITSNGPSIVILSGMLSLVITVGGPMAWVGVQLGADVLTPEALTMAVWAMIIGSIGWVLFATFSANRMEKVQEKVAGGNPAKLMAIATAAIIGAFSAMSAQHLVKMNKNSIACVLGAMIMGVLSTVSEKKNIKWLKEWNLTISILASLVITALI